MTTSSGASRAEDAHGHPGEMCQWYAADDGGPPIVCKAASGEQEAQR